MQRQSSNASIPCLFYSSFQISCGFHCYYDPVYGWHEGTDYNLGDFQAVGEVVASAAAATAKPCPQDPRAGNYLVLDHGNGHRTRYLHLNTAPLPANGQFVARGEVVGYEGTTGASTGPHLHFETRHGATTFTCGKDGTAVDPYGGSTYMWTANPPSYWAPLVEGTLFKGAGNDAVYVADQGKKRPIGSAQAFEACGYHWGEIVTVPDTTVNMMSTGSTIGTGTPCPYTLVKSFTNGTVYVIWWQAFKQVIASAEAFNACGYNWGYIVSWSDSALSPFITLTYPAIPPCFYTRYPWYNNDTLPLVQQRGHGGRLNQGRRQRGGVSGDERFEKVGPKHSDLRGVRLQMG